MPGLPTPPPTLTRRRLTSRIKKLHPAFPAELIKIAADEIIGLWRAALAAERPVVLRRFGRFEVRRYRRSTRKTLGLIFHASPELWARLNPGPPDKL